MNSKYNFLAAGNQSDYLVSESEIMKKIIDQIDIVAQSEASVLITGESGVGKKRVGEVLFSKSNRSHKSFVTVNCSAIEPKALEIDIFGCEKTETRDSKPGLVELANGGFLFLEEVSELNADLQAKILRLIKEKEAYRVGAMNPISVDIRIIASASNDLAKSVLNGSFSEELYYRINQVVLNVPSLRYRREDISKIAFNFLSHFRSKMKYEGALKVDDEVFTLLERYSWLGNLRELRNICERMVIFSRGGSISVSEVPEEIRLQKDTALKVHYDPTVDLNTLCRNYILKSLDHHKSKAKAAKALGITIKTLYNKLHEYGDFKKYAIHSNKK